MLQEGMWTRFFPAVEHARLLLEQGAIGDVVMASADFPDRCYAAQISPLAFGEGNTPTSIVASSRRSDGAGGAVVQYGETGTTVLSFPPWTSEFQEALQLTGTKGRITLDGYGHAPTRLSIHLIPSGVPIEPQGHTSTSQTGVDPVTHVHTYPVPLPTGYPAPGWHVSTRQAQMFCGCYMHRIRPAILPVCFSQYTNQTGFIYQAEAVHRCLAAGLRECPQYTKEDSLHVMQILDQINAAEAQASL
eukprot:COSAG02_NODE_3401_length_6805_cov_70.980763_3_plen_246_part_00